MLRPLSIDRTELWIQQSTLILGEGSLSPEAMTCSCQRGPTACLPTTLFPWEEDERWMILSRFDGSMPTYILRTSLGRCCM